MRRLWYNILNSSVLWTSLIFSVFATNSVVGCLHASYERYFIKKIQHFCALKEQERNDTSPTPFALTARPLVNYRLPMALPWAIFLLGLRPVIALNQGCCFLQRMNRTITFFTTNKTKETNFSFLEILWTPAFNEWHKFSRIFFYNEIIFHNE